MPEEDTIRGVEQFLFREARLLDERRFPRLARVVHRRCSLLDGLAVQPVPKI